MSLLEGSSRQQQPGAASPLARVRIVLVRPQGEINVGAVARLAKNFGAQGLTLVSPGIDPLSRQARRFADRAQDVLEAARVVHTLEEALQGASASLGTSSKIRAARDGPALSPSLAPRFLPRDDEGALALVFGAEDTGLTREEAALCTQVVRLFAPGPHESFNLSHAVAIVLAMLAAQGPEAAQPASLKARAQLEEEWLRALAAAGYFRRNTPEQFAPRLRELLSRLSPTEEDAALLRDMLRVLARRAEERP